MSGSRAKNAEGAGKADGLAIVREAASQVAHDTGAAINSGVRAFDHVAASANDAAQTQAAAGSAVAQQSSTQVRQGMERMVKNAEQMVAFGQGNLEAVMKSGQIWASGWQDLSRQMLVVAQDQFEEGMSALRSMSSLRSVKDAVELQGNLARSAMDKVLNSSTRLTEGSLKLAEQASAPLTARIGAAMEAFSVR